MIDIEKAKKTFEKYIKNYDIENGMIKLKIDHMYRVTKISREIAEVLDLSREDVDLAELIGLLHDIGRFEQVKKYGTFDDGKSINHAKQGLDVLFKENLIREFVEDSQYDNIIYKAISNHNRKKQDMDSDLTERELLYSNIIRDADKTDIFHIIANDAKYTDLHNDDAMFDEVTDEVMKEFKEEHVVDYSKRKTYADKVISHIAFIYDFNFDYGLKVISKNGYLEDVANVIEFTKKETVDKIQEAYNLVKQYMEERLGVKNA